MTGKPRKLTPGHASSKLCIRCDRVLPLSKFNANRLWANQLYRDCWCKECAKRLCRTEDDLRVYCFENNRRWEDRFWFSALSKAKRALAVKKEYLEASPAEKERIEEKKACEVFVANLANLTPFYAYEEHDFAHGEAETMATMPSNIDDDKPEYSEEWRGYYKKSEIRTLDAIYRQYEEDFVLDNVNIRDYAHKVAKASFNADVAEDRMRRGVGDSATYKEMQKIFDDMSKSSNFAACRRKPGDTSGYGSLGEIIYRLEIEGRLEDKGFTFPEDDVDRVISDFRHTLAAVGMEGGAPDAG